MIRLSLVRKGGPSAIPGPAYPWIFPAAAILAPAVWTMSLPPYGLAILAVLAPALLLVAIPGTPPRKVFWWGWLCGFLWEAGTLWWLSPTIVSYGGINPALSVVLVGALAGFLGLYMAGFLSVLSLLVLRRGTAALGLSPFLWVLFEWLRGTLFSGLPWWGPGYALSLYPALLQSARFLGVLGLSLLALMGSASLALGILNRSSKATLACSLATLALFVGAYSNGLQRLSAKPAPDTGTVRVGYLQPAIRQEQKWDPAFTAEMQRRLIQLSEAFKKYNLSLLVWPESCTQRGWGDGDGFEEEISSLAIEIGSPVLLGATLETPGGVQNGAVLILPDGRLGGRYAKTHLVPFGEYVPLKRLFSFAKPIVASVGQMERGRSIDPMPSSAGKLGVNICFEGIFPEIPRQQVIRGAEILVNITNDAWYEGTPGPVQHFFIQRVRAVETGRFLVRSANGGFSGVVNPMGQMEAGLSPGSPASFWGEVRPLRDITPFVRLGDRWLWGALLIVALFCALPVQRQRGPGEASDKK